MIKKNIEEILFFSSSGLYMIVLTFSDYLQKINAIFLTVMFTFFSFIQTNIDNETFT